MSGTVQFKLISFKTVICCDPRPFKSCEVSFQDFEFSISNTKFRFSTNEIASKFRSWISKFLGSTRIFAQLTEISAIFRLNNSRNSAKFVCILFAQYCISIQCHNTTSKCKLFKVLPSSTIFIYPRR